MAKKIDPKAKAKRQKIIAGVGGVILLGVLAFQVPRTLKMLHPADESSSSSSSTPVATAPATTTPIAAPSLAGGNATASTASAPGGDGLSDPDAVPTPASGQLLAFGLFRSKDPFIQQLNTGATGESGTTGGATTSGPTGAQGATGAGGVTPSDSGSGSSGGGTATPVTSSAAVTTAVISVNGSPESITVGGNFPAADPVFKLVSLSKSAARVGIAGGSLENGSAAVTLKKNKPVTLLNTADGTRYVLRLVSVS